MFLHLLFGTQEHKTHFRHRNNQYSNISIFFSFNNFVYKKFSHKNIQFSFLAEKKCLSVIQFYQIQRNMGIIQMNIAKCIDYTFYNEITNWILVTF